jgi:hypothetical protein
VSKYFISLDGFYGYDFLSVMTTKIMRRRLTDARSCSGRAKLFQDFLVGIGQDNRRFILG